MCGGHNAVEGITRNVKTSGEVRCVFVYDSVEREVREESY